MSGLITLSNSVKSAKDPDFDLRHRIHDFKNRIVLVKHKSVDGDLVGKITQVVVTKYQDMSRLIVDSDTSGLSEIYFRGKI